MNKPKLGTGQSAELQQQLQAIRSHFLASVWRGLAWLVVFGVPMSVSRSFFTGWLPVYSFHLVIGFFVLAVFFSQRFMSFHWLAGLLIAVLTLVGLIGAMNFGIAAPGIWFLVLSCLMVHALYGSARLSLAVAFTILSLLSLIGLAVVSGHIVLATDMNQYMLQSAAWLHLLLVSSLSVVIVIKALDVFSQSVSVTAQHQYKQWMDDLPLAIVVQNNQQQIIYANQLAQQWFNHESPQSALTPTDIYQQLWCNDRAQPYPANKLPAELALQGQTSRIQDVDRIDAQQQRRHLAIWGRPGFDLKDQLAFSIMALEDITDRRLAQLSLEDQLLHHSAILATISDAIVTLDAAGLMQSVNPAAEKLFGCPAAHLIQQSILLWIPACPTPQVVATEMQFGQVIATQLWALSEQPVAIELQLQPLQLHQQQLYLLCVRDVSERQKAEQLKNQFVSTVSHELRTPLTAIRGALGLLKGQVVGDLPAAAQQLLQLANDNTERLMLLINDLLDIQKMAAGQMRFERKRIRLMPLLQQCCLQLTHYASQRQVQFAIVEAVAELELVVDPDRLQQVLANIMSNAAKFSPSCSTVQLGVVLFSESAAAGDWVRIWIRDQGPGIAPADQHKIFEPFTQLDSSDSRQKGGTGLGLAISKVIVEQHYGRLYVDYAEPIGSCFYIELPLDAALDTSQAASVDAAVITAV